MPPHDGFRLHDDEPLGPAAPRSSHRYPECPIGVVELQPRPLQLQRPDLLSQGDILENKIGPRPKSRSKSTDNDGEKHDEELGHGPMVYAIGSRPQSPAVPAVSSLALTC